MSDSVDRVFSHALNTVNKIRTGAEKPPASVRLKLYGLYKQSMEGDVDGIMDRPEGRGEEAQRQREKWDAWKSQSGISRTEAKRRYITTLLEAMHRYASSSPDARELVAELEFVWDQVKSNVPSSSSSSPVHTLGLPSFPAPHTSSSRRYDPQPQTPTRNQDPLRMLSPLSQSQEEEEEDDDKEAEFVDAPDSQYNPDTQAGGSGQTRSESPQPARPTDRSSRNEKPPLSRKTSTSAGDRRWRQRVEQALVRMTAEIAALREQLESRRLFSHRQKHSIWGMLWRTAWFVVKHLMADLVILVIVLWWMRRKKDRRLEGAVRVLLGDAVAQARRVGMEIASAGGVKVGGKGAAPKKS